MKTRIHRWLLGLMLLLLMPGTLLACLLLIGSTVLILPVVITLFTNPEEKREWNPLSGGIRPKRWSDRFVAWLASRIR